MFKKDNIFRAVTRAVRRSTFSLIFMSAGVNLLALVSAIYMLQVYDRVLASGSLDTLVWLTLIAVAALVVYGFVDQARKVYLGRAAVWIDRELTSEVLSRHMEASLATGEKTAGPKDVADVRNYYQSDAPLAFHDAPWSLVFVAFIWILHPALGMLAITGAVIILILAVINDLLTRPTQSKLAQEIRQVNESAVRYLNSGETIRPLGMAGAIFSEWKTRQKDVRAREQLSNEITVSITSLSRSLRMGMQVAILGLGAYLVLDGAITAGAMIAASIILSRALAPIERLTSGWRKFVLAVAAKKRLSAMFSAVDSEVEKISLPRPSGKITAENVWKSPNGDEKNILRNVNFELPAGKCLAVVGPSGSGKTSLCRLLVGAWKPSHGVVRLDGADVFSWASNDLGQHIGFLPQKVELFSGTVSQNIARFSGASDAEVIEAARTAGVHELILSLPNGYETVIDESCKELSLGQRQRIALARALFGSPSLVVLDEPNSNLDREGDECLQNAISALKERSCTVVIVTHRAPILKLADLAMRLNGGQIEQFGPLERMVSPVTTTRNAKQSVAVKTGVAG